MTTPKPHDDWWLGVAWGSGWHGIALERPAVAVSALDVQEVML